MLELLTLLMCIGGDGCAEALKAYRIEEPAKYYRVKKGVEKVVYKYTDKETTIIVGSVVLSALKQDVRIKLMPNIIFRGNQDDFMVVYNLGF